MCIPKCLFYHRDDLLVQNHEPSLQKVHFRLTCVAQKRRCLSSLMAFCDSRPYVFVVVVVVVVAYLFICFSISG